MIGQTSPKHLLARSIQPRRLQQRALRYYQHNEARHWRGVLAVIISLAVLGLGWVIFFSPWLRITDVSVTGLQRLDKSVVLLLADSELNKNLLWVLPRRTWALVPITAIKKRISELPTVANMEVKRRFPNTIIITISERLASVTWQTGSQRFEVDNTGQAISEIPTSTESSLPLVIDYTNASVNLGSAASPANLIQLVLDAHKALAGRGVTSYSVEEARDHIQVHLGSWRIYLGTQASITEQQTAIDALIASLANEQVKKLDYIDVRVPDLPTYKLF